MDHIYNVAPMFFMGTQEANCFYILCILVNLLHFVHVKHAQDVIGLLVWMIHKKCNRFTSTDDTYVNILCMSKCNWHLESLY